MSEDPHLVYRDRTLSAYQRGQRLSAIAADATADEAARMAAEQYVAGVALEIRAITAQLDEWLWQTARLAASACPPHPRGHSWPRERDLVQAFTVGWEDTVPGGTAACRQLPVPGWDPMPGPTDWIACITDSGSPAAIGEMKVDKLGETLWDLLKVVSIMEHRPETLAGYLIVAATPHAWERAEACDLFNADGECDPVWETRDMLARWERSWRYLLGGGTARPVDVPARVRTRLIAAVPLTRVPGYELRCIGVEGVPGADRVTFDTDGWPSMHGDLVI